MVSRSGMSLRLSIHNSLLLAFMLMSLLLLISITVTWRAFDQVNKQQAAIVESQIPKLQVLSNVIDDGVSLLSLSSQLGRDISLEQYNRIATEVTLILDSMDTGITFFKNSGQVFEGTDQLITDSQILADEIQSLLRLRKATIDNRKRFNLRQEYLQQQLAAAALAVKMMISNYRADAQSADAIEELLFSVKRLEDIIRLLVLIDSSTFLEQEKNQYELLVNRLGVQMLVFSQEQRQQVSQPLTPLFNAMVEEDNLFDLIEQRLTLEDSLLSHQEAVAHIIIRLNEHYRAISSVANLTVKHNAIELLETIISSKYRLLIFFILFLVSMILLFYTFVRPKIINRLQSLNQSTLAIAQGDFEAVIDARGRDEISGMARSLAFFRDELIQKHKDKELLAASEKTLATIINSVSEGLFTVDVAGNIQSFNPACEHIFDVDEQTVLGSSIYQIFPDQQALFTEHSEGWLEEAGRGYLLCERKKVIANTFFGVHFTASLSVTLVQLRDQLLYTCFVRDVTAEELSKQQLDDLVQELSSSNADLEHFAYSCSHDLQEPIRMVASFSDLLEKHLVEKYELDATAQQYLGFITQGSANAKQLVVDILEYSRLNQNSSKKEWLTLADIFEQVQSMLHNLIEEKNGQFLLENGEVEVLAVPTQFKQLLMNLMINGLKYNESEKPTVTVSMVEDESGWLLSVTDNGMGIDPKYQNKIFDLFTRLVSRRDYSGSGIGLSLCKKIAEKHKGTISVTSTLGEGARFIVRLPKFHEPKVSIDAQQ